MPMAVASACLKGICNNAPDAATDAELLAALASDVALDFAESGRDPVRRAYLANR